MKIDHISQSLGKRQKVGFQKVCIITPGTIASNPRAVKEAEALSYAGYKVHLIYTRHVDYLIAIDQEILNNHPAWTYDVIDWSGSSLLSKMIKFLSGLKRRGAELLLKKSLYSSKIVPYLFNRFYLWQLKKAVACKADLYIAHYPESIGVAAKAAKINNAFFAYDAEDYHRGEDLPTWVTRAIEINENNFLNDAVYISAASELIAKAYKNHYPGNPVIAIENMFFLKNQLPFQEISNNPLKFFWFSQTIGPLRGLEPFFSILSLCTSFSFQLTLLGKASEDYRCQLEAHWKSAGLKMSNLQFLSPVPEREIFEIASRHHFGLCLEIPSVPNKDFCMSNKLYTYILSGNSLILSQTKAQNNFYNNHPDSGISIDLDKPKESAKKLSNIIESTDLNIVRRGNYELGSSQLNFDREKELLLNQVKSLWE